VTEEFVNSIDCKFPYFDGGFGLEESPLELASIADLYKVGAIVPIEAQEAVLSTNWLTFLRRSLPQTS
jgi:hypothetical protein